MIDSIRTILLRDLAALRAEIAAFDDDASLWRVLPGTTNPPGALALHVAGNLQHFIGAVLGASGYLRDRDAEFAARDLPRDHVLGELDRAHDAVDTTLAAIDGREAEPYPGDFRGEHTTIGAALIHLSGHLMYHRGQINYARRVTAG